MENLKVNAKWVFSSEANKNGNPYHLVSIEIPSKSKEEASAILDGIDDLSYNEKYDNYTMFWHKPIMDVSRSFELEIFTDKNGKVRIGSSKEDKANSANIKMLAKSQKLDAVQTAQLILSQQRAKRFAEAFADVE